MKKLALVALGGVCGSLVRYFFAEFVTSYPLAIFFANILGVAVAGLVAFRLTDSDLQKLFWIPGFAGGMTTFSSVAVIHGKSNNLASIAYFFGTVVASLVILELLDRRARS